MRFIISPLPGILYIGGKPISAATLFIVTFNFQRQYNRYSRISHLGGCTEMPFLKVTALLLLW